MEDILSELVPVDLNFLTPELLYWLNTDISAVMKWIRLDHFKH